MTIRYRRHSLRALFLTLFLTVCLTPALLRAAEEPEDDTVGLFDAWQERVAGTAGRVSKPLSQTAENVTVITAADIEAMNAHTLSDVLDTVPGLQLEHNGGPGVNPLIFMMSNNFIHTQVLLDGVSFASLGSNSADVTSIPAQIIERVEIVKGATSTAWGQALGGVINVITKSPAQRPIGGSATASIGERTTTEERLELTGTAGKTGYYLSGGFLGTNGLLPGREAYGSQLYAKVSRDLPNNGQVWGTFGYSNANCGVRYVPAVDLSQKIHLNQKLAHLGVRYTLADALELEATGRYFGLNVASRYTNISDGGPWQPVETVPDREETTGAGIKLTWRSAHHLLVTGADYNHAEYGQNTADGYTLSPFRLKADRWSIFLNDTITVGPVSIAPGVRFDHTQSNGDQVGLNLGLTWQLTDTTLLRAYTGRGHGLPELYPDSPPAVKIWATQVGMESTAIPYLWVKGSLFRNETWNIQDVMNIDYTVPERRIALGAEAEVRTRPLYHTTLGAGYTYIETTRSGSGLQVFELPRHTLQLSLRYDDKTFRGWLNGRHIYWNSPPEYNGRYGGLIWDLHLGATLFKQQENSLEIFFSGHNLFNTPHYYRDLFPTTGRWFEGGFKVRF